ncbi:MAG: hypothetical protein KME05_05520 [Gloeocapsa sp. UFS-A4-WI-NPMV-4B04]|jgi:hypothetical protein|nr:hypothetical protein [Gloeocapsa sp. UFS-A4-WI-NPMV-4B04]
MTKYPSIPTYHPLGNKGVLLEEAVSFEGEVVLTEKIDATNSRIILLPNGNFVLGIDTPSAKSAKDSSCCLIEG